MKDQWQKSLESMDLSSVILVIGILSERALKLMSEQKAKEDSAIKSPIVL